MTKCLVKFENNHLGYFYSGQVINGVVEVSLKKALACRALQLTISGKADFKWKSGKHETVKASEIYLKNVVFIFGSEDSDPVDIEAGFHTYRFSSALPVEIPSSFQSEFGKICYKVEAVFLLPWKMNYMKGKSSFKVVSHVDLNNDPTLKLPFNTEITRKIKKFFFGYRTLNLKVCTPFTGFVPGHKVKLVFDINNRTKNNVSKMKIKLVQVLKLISDGNIHTNRTVISETSTVGTQKKSANQFESDITIPTNIVPVKHSNVINLSYQIEIFAKVNSSAKKNPKFVIPIEIGTVAINCEKLRASILSLAQSVSFIRSISMNSSVSPGSMSIAPHMSPFYPLPLHNDLVFSFKE